ncbi:hypothetical protein PT286_08515 [Neisseriaceae bacterium ESL0693]|nr:hypothetical protein [Neisseriaceae bacterium ESL0693]
MKTYTINHNLLAAAADALLKLEHFSWYTDILAASIQHSAQHQNYVLIERLADMLEQLASEVQNCQAGNLSADLSHLLDADNNASQQNI